ncbi:unnamed protein product [Linum tenue]|uniref:Uncharacterized protein n=2 Tax=Linum tenue TaxID=586396 RepID=A0AAV0KPZ6_9ROSI|nr:unnamed protein product [Linum tenue]
MTRQLRSRSARSVWENSWMGRKFGFCPSAITGSMCRASTNGCSPAPPAPTVGILSGSRRKRVRILGPRKVTRKVTLL